MSDSYMSWYAIEGSVLGHMSARTKTARALRNEFGHGPYYRAYFLTSNSVIYIIILFLVTLQNLNLIISMLALKYIDIDNGSCLYDASMRR